MTDKSKANNVRVSPQKVTEVIDKINTLLKEIDPVDFVIYVVTFLKVLKQKDKAMFNSIVKQITRRNW